MASLASVLTVSCVFLLFVCMMVAGEELSCPRLPSQPGSTPLDLSGLRFFLDPSLDPAIGEILEIPQEPAHQFEGCLYSLDWTTGME